LAEAHAAPRSARVRLAIVAGVALAWLLTAGLAGYDVTSSAQRARVETEASLAGLADVVNALHVAEEGRIDGELERLRTELRAQGAWSESGAFEADGSGASATPGDRGEIDGRRLEAALRRALVGVDAFSALEIVVAGHDGLRLLGVERDGEGRATVSGWAPDEREGVAKALWYADEVDSAVQSAGRRVERGEVSFEGVIARPVSRAAIGLHDAGQLVQGALVAVIDLTDVSTRLAQMMPTGHRITLVSVEGRPLDPATRDEATLTRLGALTTRVFAEPDGTTVFEADGALVLGRPLARPDGGVATTLALLEAEAPPVGLSAWLASLWLPPLVLFAIVAALAIVGLLRPSVAAAPAQASPRVATADEASDDVAADLEMHPEPMVLREWLADVRGCLEREAATRGLAIDVRCERSLPDDLESDPGWLGGLVVAMGREALDATGEEKVRVDVTEDAGASLRVEVDAGGASLAPVAGMHEVAGGVGGRLESAKDGRLALVVPSVLS